MAKAYVFTPARRAALHKAQTVSAAKRRGRHKPGTRRRYTHNLGKRGEGFTGLRKNTIPYLRANKRSQTTGFNAGTVIPGTKKRIVLGGYVRVENTGRKGGIDAALSRSGNFVAPRGTRRGSVKSYLSKNVTIKNPGLRANVGGHTVSLGTSRGAGPTVIVRRGRKPTPISKSRRGIQKFDKNVNHRVGKTRMQRRGK